MIVKRLSLVICSGNVSSVVKKGQTKKSTHFIKREFGNWNVRVGNLGSPAT